MAEVLRLSALQHEAEGVEDARVLEMALRLSAEQHERELHQQRAQEERVRQLNQPHHVHQGRSAEVLSEGRHAALDGGAMGASAVAATSLAAVDSAPGCAWCGATGVALMLCAGCEGARYCDARCQAKAWPSHKRECKILRKRRAAANTAVRAPLPLSLPPPVATASALGRAPSPVPCLPSQEEAGVPVHPDIDGDAMAAAVGQIRALGFTEIEKHKLVSMLYETDLRVEVVINRLLN